MIVGFQPVGYSVPNT